MSDLLRDHLQICDELHQLALEENRFLKQHQRVPDLALLQRHQALVDRLEASLAGLRTGAASAIPADPEARASRAAVVEQARGRLLQILHLQRENEQLVLRHSLGPARTVAPVTPPPASRLQKLYEQHSG
ncbi:hypothetical protein [Rariglobus hedericola]|uniref:Flagellar protein FlgN n=1 Tax=Rariglobus hedericola TaxID=2597822 RepID=A0A556QPL9_9BACT|nr:hypothetical protein [Rariglobus hedericola]TSJ78593.1 hypothetical protein FPL22_04635 [Rariglobus hedericola]